MQIRIQKYKTMKKGKLEETDNLLLSFRLKDAEAVRFVKIFNDAYDREHRIEKTEVIREVLELTPPDALKPEEIIFFRTGKKTGNKKGIEAGELKPAKRIKNVA